MSFLGGQSWYQNSTQKKELKRRLYDRDGKRCYFCPSKERLEIDHIVPIFVGGKWNIENLGLLCHECHRKKTQRFDRAFVLFAQDTVERTLHNLDKIVGQDEFIPLIVTSVPAPVPEPSATP